ncbi:hypothetical protein [Kitasatospora sp. NPDC098663]|uniref:hypothetical protein n=1 Tax=Kitasatospora sp. NPDC098663 TaxID=3364096 RepID=UPI00381A605F
MLYSLGGVMTENWIHGSSVQNAVQADVINGGVHLGREAEDDKMRNAYKDVYEVTHRLLMASGSAIRHMGFMPQAVRTEWPEDFQLALSNCVPAYLKYEADLKLFSREEVWQIFREIRLAVMEIQFIASPRLGYSTHSDIQMLAVCVPALKETLDRYAAAIRATFEAAMMPHQGWGMANVESFGSTRRSVRRRNAPKN